MFQDLGDSETRVSIFAEHLLEEVFTGKTQSIEEWVSVEVEWFVHNFEIALLFVFVPEGWLSRQKHVHEASNAPDIHSLAVW